MAYPSRILVLTLFLCLARAAAGEPAALSRPSPEVAAAIRDHLAADQGPTGEWYASRVHAPAWDQRSFAALARFLGGLDRHGLRPELFHLSRWQAAWEREPASAAEAARLDVDTTHLALYAIQSLAHGFVDPVAAHPKWEPVPQRVSPLALLDTALKQGPGEFGAWLEEAAAPPDPRYRELVATLARYREIEGLGGWKPLPAPDRPAGLSDSYPEVALLRARLRAEGDLPPDAPRIRPQLIDSETYQAIQSFQFRHGIDPDGVIGPQTLAELNQPARHRVNMLVINLDRLRWMPSDYERSAHLEVNLAENVLRLFSGGRSLDTMRVIVGKKGEHQTPVFRGSMRRLYFRPYWNVPLSIARSEVVPQAQADPAYLSRGGFEIVPAFGVSPDQALPATRENLEKAAAGRLSIRQGPGPSNALGMVKFIFPNDNSVYLHDTPNHDLFRATHRDFSHGCVRVSKPDELAGFVLGSGGEWTLEKIREAMRDEARPNRQVNLPEPIPVYLIYWTSTIMDDGRVRFDRDIYGHDADLFRRFGLNGEALPAPVSRR